MSTTHAPYEAHFVPVAYNCSRVRKNDRPLPDKIKHSKGGIIYAIYFHSRCLVKIGYTSKPAERFKTLSQNMCENGFWFGAFYGTRTDERAALKHFEMWRARGEFFRCNLSLVKEIERYFLAQEGRCREINLAKPRYT